MGGDEFCVLAICEDDGTPLAELAAAALGEDGEAFRIDCAYGVATVGAGARAVEEALHVADGRMYANKTSGRLSASRQTADALLTVVGERNRELGDHIGGVAELAEATARLLGLPDSETRRVRLAAELHDIGKAAIPDSVLNKPGPLDKHEWEFIRTHTLIGERIVRAAPSLAPIAELVRSSHERIDGSGYPDRLAGEAIPLGARIVSICDAFDAIVSDRPYQPARSIDEALKELRRGAGRQFDAQIVTVFCTLIEGRQRTHSHTLAV
jgi:HD-GYP domain-containing protein (c-di-GMP phosphodiesterase class II)